MTNIDDFLWCQKYRPKTVADTILPEELKATFQQFVDDKNIPNLLLSGRAGVGKTTIAKAMLDEIDADYIVINGSDEGRQIDVLTCNFKNRIIDPLHSRCSVIDFNITNKDKPKIAAQFFKRVCSILDNENVEYEQKAVAELVQTHFPDWRRVLNELQRYSSTGKIDSGILANRSSDNINALITLMKEKNFSAVRKWAAENSDVDSAVLYRQLYDILPTKLNSTSSIADAIIILAEYQYKEAFAANPEINRVAALATLMAEMDWK
jgi:DNA polymerase III delta prime subunit